MTTSDLVQAIHHQLPLQLFRILPKHRTLYLHTRPIHQLYIQYLCKLIRLLTHKLLVCHTRYATNYLESTHIHIQVADSVTANETLLSYVLGGVLEGD